MVSESAERARARSPTRAPRPHVRHRFTLARSHRGARRRAISSHQPSPPSAIWRATERSAGWTAFARARRRLAHSPRASGSGGARALARSPARRSRGAQFAQVVDQSAVGLPRIASHVAQGSAEVFVGPMATLANVPAEGLQRIVGLVQRFLEPLARSLELRARGRGHGTSFARTAAGGASSGFPGWGHPDLLVLLGRHRTADRFLSGCARDGLALAPVRRGCHSPPASFEQACSIHADADRDADWSCACAASAPPWPTTSLIRSGRARTTPGCRPRDRHPTGSPPCPTDTARTDRRPAPARAARV
jgi:hypothetical protein